MQYPILKERTQAVWDYLKEYTILNDGHTPVIRDFVRDSVHNLTSTSLVQYHLEKLEAAGLIEIVQDGNKHRRIKIISGVYQLPVNVIDDIILTDDFVRIKVDTNSEMLEVIYEFFENWKPPSKKAVIVTDNPNVAMIAMGFGLMVVRKEEETKDEDGGTD